MSKKIKNEQKKFLGETLNQYDKALNEGINQLDKKNREQNHKISSLVNSFDNEYLEKDVEGNMTALENSKDGMVIINEIQGNTEVNYCKDGEKELILNGDIDTQGESFVTITEGVDGGLVDVSLEGNTEINLSKTKDPVLVTREFDDIDCNTGKLQYTIDDVTTINDEPGKVDIDRIVGDTMVNHAVNGSEELILNAHINESGDNSIKLNGVTSDGGKVDVFLEGNTLVNVSKTKDDYITPTIEDKVDKGSVISLPEASEGYINIDGIEGNTLVNYCTDGAKELTLNGDIDVEGNFVTTTEGVDNGLVDIMCEGNTLINLIKIDTSEYKTIGHASSNMLALGDASLFRNGIQYTIICEFSDIVGNAVVCFNFNSGGSAPDIYVKPTQGLVKHTFTMPTEPTIKTNAQVSVYYFDQENSCKIKNLIILEGDWTDKEIPSYFKGMKSVGQDDENGHKIEVVSQNKNLIDINRFEVAGLERGTMSIDGDVLTFNYTGTYPTIRHVFTQKEINLLQGKTFKFGHGGITDTVENNNLNIRFVASVNGSDKYYVFFLSNGNYNTVTLPNNMKSLEFSIVPNNTSNDIQGTFTINNIQLLFADTENTDYIKHQSNKKEILLNEPLRSLPNGVKDRFVKIGGKWYIERKCKEVVLNGTEAWDLYRGDNAINEYPVFYHVIPNIALNHLMICDKIPVLKTIDGNCGKFAIGSHSTNNSIRICIESSKLSSRSANAFKEWLQTNPTTVVYQLTTPTYEPLEIEPTLNTYNEITHLSNNSIIPCNMQIKNTGYNALIKPSTLYTVALDTNKSETIGLNLGGAKVITTNNVATITTPETLTDDSLRIYGKGIKASGVRLLEGDKTNWIPSFFEGMQSSFEDKVQDDGSYKIEILMSNRNLIDIQNISFKNTTDYTLENNKIIINSSKKYQAVYYYIPVKRGTTYTICCKNITGGTLILLYRGKITGHVVEKYLGSIYDTSLKKRVIVDEDYITIRVSNENSINTECIFEDILFYEGVEDVDYVPHKSNKIQLSSIEPLRGVGTAKDRLVFKDGKLMIERNYRVKVFDGSADEDWWVSSTQIDGYNCYVIRLNDALIDYHLNEKMLCDKVYVNNDRKLNTIIPLVIDDNTAIGLYYTDSSINVTDFKNKLKSNPITVVYPLAEPTYEEIPYDLQKIILESYTNGTLFIDTNIPPTKVSFNCFEEELTYLYPSTSYTVQFISDRYITADITLGGTQLLAQNIVKGLNRISITTPTTLTDNKLVINGAGAKISKVVVTNTSRHFKYFEGMKSVGECEELEVKSENKNLFDIQNIAFKGTTDYKLENNKIIINSSIGYTGIFYYIQVKKGINYTICCKNITCGSILLYEGKVTSHIANKHLNSLSSTQLKISVVTDEDYITIRVSNETDKNMDCIFEDILFYEGSIATDYIPHQSNTQQLTHEPLRAVGDVKDRYVLIDGNWYIERKCGIRAYQEGDKTNYKTDLINTVYPLEMPTYEEIDYTPFEVYSGTTHITTNSTIPCNITVKNHGFNCLLKPNTTYTVSSNLGLNTVTTPSTLAEDCLRFMDTDTSNVTTMRDVLVLEGDWTTKADLIPSNFSGIESAFEQEYDTEKGKYKVNIKVTNEDKTKENNITFYINEPLRGIGDVKDRIYVKDDKVVVQRNCASATLDGSEDENWTYWFNSGQIVPDMLSCVLDNFIEYNKALGTDIRCICDTIIAKSLADIFNEGIALRQTGDTLNRIYVSIKNIYNYPQTVEGFKRYLSQKPLKLVYQLAEPTYEEVEYSSNRLILNTFNNESFNNSTLFLDTNISPKLSFKPLYEELVYVKNSTKYYIQFNAVGSGEAVINLGGTELTTEIVEGYNCIPITTPSESTNLMTMIGQGITISEVVVSEVVCGGYYKGIQSCFEEHMENGKYRVLLRGIALDGSKVNGIKLYINEPLRGIEDIKDRLCIKNGKLMVERKCGSVTLSCTGNIWDTTAWGASSDKTIEFRLGYNQFENKKGKILCDNFISETSNLWVMDTEGIQSYTVDTVDIRINKTRLSTQDVAGFRQWLQQNPTTIVYQLVTPQYEEVTNEYGLPIVFEGYENGIVYIDSAVTPTTHIKYTSNNQLATTLSEAEEQNTTTQEDINMNVVTYMMDIDMILTEMEMSNDTSVMAVRRDNGNENMLDRMSDEDKKVYRDNTVVMLEKMITANVLEKEDIERRIDMYYNKNRISKEQYEYLKSLL